MIYAYRKERDGWEVWAISSLTGDPKELVDTVETEELAQSLVDRLYEAAMNRKGSSS